MSLSRFNCVSRKTWVRLLPLLVIYFLRNDVYAQYINYYVDPIIGSDSNTGTNPATAWKTLTKVNSKTFQPGDSLLFICGGIWTGQLYPKGSGNSSKPITIGKYGNGNLPIIIGNGTSANQNIVYLYNQQYWKITNLEITSNPASPPTLLLRGVYIQAHNSGTIRNIQLLNLNIHDVKGNIDDKDCGGIFVEVTGTSTPTKFDSLIIDGCTVKDCDRTGISNASSWATRSLTNNTNWTPSTNVIVRNNWIENSGGNGMIIRVASKPLIERNVFKHCGQTVSGNAVFTFNCDDALVQYNESYLTVFNVGDADASGFDSDYRCKRSIFQYNYSHDNDDGFIVVTCWGGADRFNDSTIVRYNISQNDGGAGSTTGGIVYLSGTPTNTLIYNNVIYSGPSNSLKRVVFHNSWNGYPDYTSYYNNIFTILKAPSSTAYNLSSSTNNLFDYNLYYGQHPSSEPNDAHKLTSDPKFVNPGSGSVGIGTVDGYKLQPNSPAINSGFQLPNYSIKDFWGNPVPNEGGNIDRGAHERSAAVFDIKFIPEGFYNPSNNRLNLKDTFVVYLTNNQVPFAIIDSNKIILDSITFLGKAKFQNLPNGTYYTVIKHRNVLETWSRTGGVTYNEGVSINYDFTNDSSNAFGNNMRKIDSKWCIYSGDVNRDGIIDLTDVSLVDIDNLNFLTGYVVTDNNGDGLVDLSDLSLVDINNLGFISKSIP